VDIPKVKINKETLRQTGQMLRYLRPYRGKFFLGLALLIFSSAVTLVFPRVTGNLVDAATGTLQGYDRNSLALILMGILIVQGIFSFLRILVFAQVSENTLRDIRQDLYKKLISLPIPFFEQRRVGELTSRITADVGQLNDVLSFTLAEFVRQFVTLLVGIGVILVTSTQLTLVMLSSFPVLIIVAVVFGRFIRKLSKQVTDELASANTVAEETMQGISTVKSFTNEGYELGRYGFRLRNVTNLALRSARFRGGFVSFVIFSIFGSIVLVLWYGLGLVAANEITIGQLVSFIIYTTFIGGAAGGLGDLYSQLQKTAGASQRILEILQEKGEVEVTEGGLLPSGKRLTGAITFDEVRFRYPSRPDVEVLQGINFTINPGQVIALVGPSGAGKSTIAQLLMRFHTPTGGQILIDGQTTTHLDLHYLRSQIGIVPQEVLLFGGTLRENIEYGRPGASLADIRQAAARANALTFIDGFPEGLETVVGERGIKLSGGQRQRIAIARALLKDPAILILDEATNALDTESEALVQDALEELMRGRTTLVIAHRLHTIRRADRILVIADGAVAEQGTHAELAIAEGRYAQLLQADRSFESSTTAFGTNATTTADSVLL
jgi:ABC-type multidrug transport system fused ATPase/permease subunit